MAGGGDPFYLKFWAKLNSIALLTNHVIVVEGRPMMSEKFCPPVPVFHFWP